MIYPIMSDEQRRQWPKGPRPFGLQRKSPPGSSKGSTVLPIRSSPFSCPLAILAATRLAETMSFDPGGADLTFATHPVVGSESECQI
ncbi:MAG: hypothetical protein J2P55_17475, partial [Rhizobiales bacterium]|nr:hypothetical protein [Hyphomicrobiales bacterium]